MKSRRSLVPYSESGAAAIICLAFALAAPGPVAAQTGASAPQQPRFDVISFKHVGNVTEFGWWEGAVHHGREWKPLNYRGVRLSGELPLISMVRYAYSLAGAGYCEAPDWMGTEWYRVEAIAPTGTTQERARLMLQAALAQRLALQYHLIDKQRRILALLRGAGDLKLIPSVEQEPNPGRSQLGVFRNRSASLSEFASFLAWVAGTPVVDRTGITGSFRFDIDWSAQVGNPRDGAPSVAIQGVKKFGLRLEAGKEEHQWMVIDRASKEPTPN